MHESDVEIGALDLENGARIPRVVQRVTRYGSPAADGSNVVIVTHALTGSSRAADWWGGLIGPGKLFDPATWCVVGINALGSCYGSTGPASAAPDGVPYGARFPIVTVADMVNAQRRALAELGIAHAAIVIGGSLGGMQALAWGLVHGDAVGHAIVVGAYDAFSALGIGLNAVARQAILDDPAFAGGDYAADAPPVRGMRLARMIAMLTYKSDALLEERFANRPDRAGGDPRRNRTDRFDVEGYLAYQGDIFAKRMDANSYLALTRAMDTFDMRTHTPRSPDTQFTLVGIEHDWLFPSHYVERAAARLVQVGAPCTYLEMRTNHGHDAFLAETGSLAALLAGRVAYTAARTGKKQ